jgi:hypothetical protein
VTTWSKERPFAPGWYWWRTGHGDAPMPQWCDSKKPFPPWSEFGPRIPSPEAVAAAKDALREALPHFHAMCHDECSTAEKCRAALAKLEARP